MANEDNFGIIKECIFNLLYSNGILNVFVDQNCVEEAFLMSIHNIHFHDEERKFPYYISIFLYSLAGGRIA